MTMLENRLARPFADDDAVALPELTNADMEWIVDQLDPDWRDHFPYIDAAWEFYYPLNQPEMDRLIAEVDDDNRRAFQRGSLRGALEDISRGLDPKSWAGLARKQVG